MLCIIEKLTAPSFIMRIFPRLKDLRKQEGNNTIAVYYIDATLLALWLSNFAGYRLKIKFQQLDFKLFDIYTDDGDLAYLKVSFFDILQLFLKIKQSAELQKVIQQIGDRAKWVGFFLAKQAIAFGYYNVDSLWRLLCIVHLSRWKAKQDGILSRPVILFAGKRLWIKEVKEYIRDWGVHIEVVHPVWELKKKIIDFFNKERFRSLLYLYRCYGFRAFFAKQSCFSEAKRNEGEFVLPASGKKINRLMVEYYGHLNIDNPEMHSDLFFAQQSDFRREDIIVSFNYLADIFDQNKAGALKAFGASAVVLNPKATTFSPRGIFHYNHSRYNYKSVVAPIGSVRVEESNWLNSQIKNYYVQAAYWRELFKRFYVSVYFSWYKNDTRHTIISDVLHELGGVSAFYQRSFENEPHAGTSINVDLFFGFSNETARIEKASGSVIPYYIITGYNGDHRFNLVENKASEVRRQLLHNGAKHIIAFFDESSISDTRWHAGHKFTRENYEFLILRALEDRSLGLIFKPKVPKTLRQRLGPVAKLLKDLESQGRCFVFEVGVAQGAYPPAVAAKASDIAIHGHLCAGTAGIEAALAGIPTILLDREGWPSCSFYAQGTNGKIVFRSWESLWPVLIEHLKRSGGVPGFADWSYLLDTLDPFRDGRAAERIGNYLSWVMDGLRAGHLRNQVLDDAAQRYMKMWGKDKVVTIN